MRVHIVRIGMMLAGATIVLALATIALIYVTASA